MPSIAPGLVRVLRHRRSAITVSDSDCQGAADRHFGQAEVENLAVAALGHENIGRLDVAMNDALGVRRIQRIGDLDGDGTAAVPISSGLPAMRCFQRRAFQKLHGDEGVAVVLADVVNRADVGMIQRRRGLRLALKTSERLRIARHVIRKELQRDEAVQPGVFGLVDHTHAAAAELLDDAVVRDGWLDHPAKTVKVVSRW